MITRLSLKNIGPASDMEVEFGQRLNIITGDNGLGKTFILDACWFALTGTWAGGNMFLPLGRGTREAPPEINSSVIGKGDDPVQGTSRFNFDEQYWPRKVGRPIMPGLVIYARIDGGFSVWDPARNYWRDRTPDSDDAREGVPGPGRERPYSYDFKKEEVWDGLTEKLGDTRREICNGLIRDVEAWRLKGNQAFSLLQNVLTRLSPDNIEHLEIGAGMRVSIDDVRETPTLILPYGAVPVTKAAAGMRRILALAYLIVWAWDEHKIACRALGIKATERIVFLFDEVEAHLHPKWQRRLLPAIIKALTGLVDWRAGGSAQFICTTHSPLVLASMEPHFDTETDELLHLDIGPGAVVISPLEWATRGKIGYWLTSELFGLREDRSQEAEIAIQAAKDFMGGHLDQLPEGLRTAEEIHGALKQTLSGQDPFWPRWMMKTGLED